MRRREFIAAVAGAVAGPLAAWAQQTPKIARIGFLVPSSADAPASRENFGAIRRQFAELGYIEGQNIIFEQRGADGVLDRLPAVAAELVSLKPDVVIALSTPAARAVQRATTTIPIVVGSVGDPVGDGLVASLSHPGGNITGTTFLGPELVAKRFDLLKELIPKMSRVAVLWNPRAFSAQTTADMVSEVAEAAKSLRLQLQYVEARGAEEFERAFSDAVNWHSDALFEFPNPTFYENAKWLVDLAAQHRLPAIYNARSLSKMADSLPTERIFWT